MYFCCTSKKLQLLLIFISAVTIVTILLILFIHNWPTFARKQVVENLVFKNGTLGMERFQKTSDLRNLRLSFSLFSVTNVEQVVKSAAKIQLKEYGPFVYHEFRWKELLDNDQENGRITYKLRRRYVFRPDLSVGDPKTIQVTWLNVPVISSIALIEKLDFFKRLAAKEVLEIYMARVKEAPFITDTVDRFLFSGSYRELFALLYANPVVRDLIGKWPLPDNRFAILYDRNNTWNPDKDHIFTVKAGFGPHQNYTHLNEYELMDGSMTLPFWKTSGDCNRLTGTDGEFFSPLMQEHANLTVYSSDICRKINLRYRNTAFLHGINTWRYTLDETSFLSPAKYPNNKCYCLAASEDQCKLDGLIDLSLCVGNEVFASASHFLHGSPELLTRIVGMRPPDPSLDEPILHLEPQTGSPIQVKIPLQFNIRLSNSNYSIFKWSRDIEPQIVPLVTVTEAAELEDDQAATLRSILLLLDSWFIVMVLGGAIILIIVIIVVITVLCMRFKSSRSAQNITSERDPLLGPVQHRSQGSPTYHTNIPKRVSRESPTPERIPRRRSSTISQKSPTRSFKSLRDSQKASASSVRS